MARQVHNEFCNYEFESAQEEKSADLLPAALMAKLHNLRADILREKASLNYDVTSPLQNVQKEAFLSGQRAILDLLIDAHNELIANLSEESRN